MFLLHQHLFHLGDVLAVDLIGTLEAGVNVFLFFFAIFGRTTHVHVESDLSNILMNKFSGL